MFGKSERQQIINEYLRETGREMFVPAEFLDWLRPKGNHPCHRIFFGKDDAEAAHEWRVDQVRRWVSGLRITVHFAEPVRRNIGTVVVHDVELPAAFSPMASRTASGGYLITDSSDPEHIAEIGRQAAQSMRSWADRFGGIATILGIDPDRAMQIAADLDVACNDVPHSMARAAE